LPFINIDTHIVSTSDPREADHLADTPERIVVTAKKDGNRGNRRMNSALSRRLGRIETVMRPAGQWLPGIRIIHDPEKDGPLGDDRVQAIWHEEMDRRIAAGEAQPGDDFPIIVRVIIHPMPRGTGYGQA